MMDNSYIRVLLINQSGTVIFGTEVNATTGEIVRATPANSGTHHPAPKTINNIWSATATNGSTPPVSSPCRKPMISTCELAEYVFGSVALNFSGMSCISKMHQIDPCTIITSNVFNVPANNNTKTKVPRKIALVIVWHWSDKNGVIQQTPLSATNCRNGVSGANGVSQLETSKNGFNTDTSKPKARDSSFWRQLIYNQSDLIDSLIADLRFRICEKQHSSQKIQQLVNEFTQSICDLLAAERLSMQVSQAQFIDDLAGLISKYDTKSTHFFISRLISSVLINKSSRKSIENTTSKSPSLRVVVYSQNAKNSTLIRRLLTTINYFLNDSECHENVYSPPDFNEFEFKQSCDELTPPNRKSREEVSGYGSFTDSFTGSTHFIGEPCEHYRSHHRTSFSIDDLDGEATSEEGAEDNEIDDDVNNLDQTKLYIKEYHSLRFSNCPKCGTVTQSKDDVHKLEGDRLCQRAHALSITNSDDSRVGGGTGGTECGEAFSDSGGVRDDKIKNGESQGDVAKEVIVESKGFPGFGQTQLPQLLVINRKAISTPIWKTPAISNNYLPKLQLQAIINQDCKFPQPKNDELFIFANIDNWTINICDKGATYSAMMSSSIGNMCEKIALFQTCDMNPKFVAAMIQLTLLELLHKSHVLLSILGEKCWKISTFDDNALDQINNSCNFKSLGFHISDVPLLISLQRQYNLTNHSCSLSKSSKREATRHRHLEETSL